MGYQKCTSHSTFPSLTKTQGPTVKICYTVANTTLKINFAFMTTERSDGASNKEKEWKAPANEKSEEEDQIMSFLDRSNKPGVAGETQVSAREPSAEGKDEVISEQSHYEEKDLENYLPAIRRAIPKIQEAQTMDELYRTLEPFFHKDMLVMKDKTTPIDWKKHTILNWLGSLTHNPFDRARDSDELNKLNNEIIPGLVDQKLREIER
jgi:hypothetical protein